MNVTCSRCETVYRIDPEKVPSGGVRAQCARCPEIIDILMDSGPAAGDAPISAEATSPPPAVEEAKATEPMAEPTSELVEVPVARSKSAAGGAAGQKPIAPFGSADPAERARRLARALVSDIVVYNRDRWTKSLNEGSLRVEFREEIRRSWDEYATQVGNQFARETSYFRDALNEILADGSRVF